MASSMFLLARSCLTRSALSPSSHALRRFSTSSVALAQGGKTEDPIPLDRALEALSEDFDDDDTSSAGHLMLRQQREVLYYLRLIEHEMPKLVAYRKPFIPPTSETPLIVRSLDYAGEEHPATAKRVIVVSVDQLPLRDERALHKIKLLAGPRWTPNPPADAGVSGLATWDNGFIKVSCEDFPEPAMNLKWASDALDRLVAEANDTNDTFSKVPVDLRHVHAKARKAKRGEHRRGRTLNRVTALDFPKEWLPTRTPAPSMS